MNPQHLLEQAERLSQKAPGGGRQSDLRRAVSAAYYAVFHLLTLDAARRFSVNAEVWPLVARAFDHAGLKRIALELQHPSRSAPAQQPPPPDLVTVAKAVIRLQESRHQADYDMRPSRHFKRADVLQLIGQARAAVSAWTRVRTDPAAELFLLTALGLFKRDRQ